MSYSSMHQGKAVNPVFLEVGNERAAYMAKVYGLFFTGVIAFFACSIFPLIGEKMGIPLMGAIVASSVNLNPILAFVLLLAFSFGAGALSMKRGVNLVAFYGFAAFFGWLSIGLMYYAIERAGGSYTLIFQAGGLTTFVMGGLSLYVIISRKDFSFMGGFLTVGLLMLIGASLLLFIMSMVVGVENIQWLHTGLVIASTLLFMGYVLYDTSQIMHRYSTDMVVPAALSLLIDFIMLFRNILFLLAAGRD